MNFVSSEQCHREGAAMGLQTGRMNSSNRGGSKSAAVTAVRPAPGDFAGAAIIKAVFCPFITNVKDEFCLQNV